MSENRLLRVKAISAKNIGVIKSCDLEFRKDERMIPLRGPNGSGKTTLLQILNSAESGRNLPDEPVRHGCGDAEFSFELVPVDGDGDHVEVTRTFTSDGKKELKAFDGDKKASQTVLSSLIGRLRDPLKLIDKTGTELLQEVLPMVNLHGFSLDDNKAKLAAATDQRKDAGKTVTRLDGSVKTAKNSLGDFDSEAPGLSSLMDRLDEAQTASTAANEKGEELEKFRKAYAESAQARRDAIAEIESMELKLRHGREALLAVEVVMSDGITKGEALKAEYDSLVELVPDMEALKASRAQAEANDEKRTEAANLSKLKANLAAAEAAQGAADDLVEKLRAEAKEALAEADWPCSGMSYSVEENEIRLHGALWAAASTGERITAAIEIATAQPSALRVLWIENALLLDRAHLEHVDQLLHAKNYWAFTEFVDDEPNARGKKGIAFENGKVARCNGGSK